MRKTPISFATALIAIGATLLATTAHATPPSSPAPTRRHLESGSGDAGSGDAGSGDTGSGDTGSGDTGSGDAGSGDAGSGDAGSGEYGSGAPPPPSEPGSGDSGQTYSYSFTLTSNSTSALDIIDQIRTSSLPSDAIIDVSIVSTATTSWNQDSNGNPTASTIKDGVETVACSVTSGSCIVTVVSGRRRQLAVASAAHEITIFFAPTDTLVQPTVTIAALAAAAGVPESTIAGVAQPQATFLITISNVDSNSAANIADEVSTALAPLGISVVAVNLPPMPPPLPRMPPSPPPSPSPPSPPPSPSPPREESPFPVAAVASAAAGGFVLILIIIALVVVMKKKRSAASSSTKLGNASATSKMYADLVQGHNESGAATSSRV